MVDDNKVRPSAFYAMNNEHEISTKNRCRMSRACASPAKAFIASCQQASHCIEYCVEVS